MDNKKHILFTTIGPGPLKPEFIRALQSWRSLYFGGYIIIWSDVDHPELFEYLNSFDIVDNVIVRNGVSRTEFGLPIVRSLFTRTQELYPDALTYTYVNSDIEFNAPLMPIIEMIMDIEDQFMLVGQRTDVYEDGTEELHNPGGIDYFCYTNGFWDLTNMPDFSIARGRFDHYLMGYALRYGRGPVIDITADFKVLHPEPLDRKPGDVGALYQRGEFALGYQVLRNHYHFANAKLHGQTNYAPYKLVNGELYRDNTVYQDEFKQVIKNDILH